MGAGPLALLAPSLLHSQRLGKIGFQKAASAVTKHLGFCDVGVIESCSKLRVLAHVAPEVTSALHPDRPPHDAEPEQCIGVLLEPVDHELRRFLDLATERLLRRMPGHWVAV